MDQVWLRDMQARDLTNELAADEILAARKFALDLAASAMSPSGEAAARLTAETAAVLAGWLLTGCLGNVGVQPLSVENPHDIPQQSEDVGAVERAPSFLAADDVVEHDKGQVFPAPTCFGHDESPSVGRAPKLTDGAPASNGGGA